jgi:hypothetical protein
MINKLRQKVALITQQIFNSLIFNPSKPRRTYTPSVEVKKMPSSTNELKLANYLLERYGLSWDQYLERFGDTKPLELWPTNLCPKRLNPEEVKCEIDLIRNLSNSFRLKRWDKEYKIIGGFKKKVKREEVEKLNYLHSNFLGLGLLLHKKIIDKMLELCSDDFQPIPVTLVSQHKQVEPFENKDFYALNVVKCIDALDKNKSTISFSESTGYHVRNSIFKEHPWQDGCILSVEKKDPIYFATFK